MAIAFSRFSTISRSAGRSSTAAAAYRAGDRITDERTGEIHDYRRKQGVVSAEIIAPDDAPAWATDRRQLHNKIELTEKRKDAQLVRENVLAIPDELDWDQGRELVRRYVKEQFADAGMVADVAFHEPSRAGDERNKHAHVLLTMRPIEGNDFGKKERSWNAKPQGEKWKAEWVRHARRALMAAGHSDAVELMDEKQKHTEHPMMHLGPVVTAMERRGIQTELGDINRHRQAANTSIFAAELRVAATRQYLDMRREFEKHQQYMTEKKAQEKREAVQKAAQEEKGTQSLESTRVERERIQAALQEPMMAVEGRQYEGELVEHGQATTASGNQTYYAKLRTAAGQIVQFFGLKLRELLDGHAIGDKLRITKKPPVIESENVPQYDENGVVRRYIRQRFKRSQYDVGSVDRPVSIPPEPEDEDKPAPRKKPRIR